MDIKKLEKFSVENYWEGTTPLLFKLLGGEWTMVDVGVKGDWKLVFSKNNKLFIYEDGKNLLVDFRYPSKLGIKQALYCNYKDVEYEPALFGEGFKWTPGNTVKGIKLGEVKKGINEKVDWTKEEKKLWEEGERRVRERAKKDLDERLRKWEEEREKKRKEKEKYLKNLERFKKLCEGTGLDPKWLMDINEENEELVWKLLNRKYPGGIYNTNERGCPIDIKIKKKGRNGGGKTYEDIPSIFYEVQPINIEYKKSKFYVQIDLKDTDGNYYKVIEMPNLDPILSNIRIKDKKIKGLNKKDKKSLIELAKSQKLRISLDFDDGLCRWWPLKDKGDYIIGENNATYWVYDTENLYKKKGGTKQ